MEANLADPQLPNAWHSGEIKFSLPVF